MIAVTRTSFPLAKRVDKMPSCFEAISLMLTTLTHSVWHTKGVGVFHRKKVFDIVIDSVFVVFSNGT